jgi:hypothetical protein
MSRQNIIRRLRYLRNWEFINIFLLPAILYFTLMRQKTPNWQPFAFGMFVICIILAQGTFYWHLKLQSVYKNELVLPSYFERAFSLFKWVNVALLSIYPILMIANRITPLVHFQTSFWSNALFLFALLEQVNYYHYQLSHDNLNDIRFLIKHKKFRRSPLYVDLQRTSKRVPEQKAG